MMKKILILMLVLGLVSIANATVTMELYEADGTTPVSGDCIVGSSYVLAVEGASADAGASLGLYGSTYTAADWANLGAGGQSAATKLDTGDLSYINWVASWYGYDMLADDTGMGSGVSTGTWFTIDLTGLAEGTYSFDLLDYGMGSAVIASESGNVVIPEPITIALLGLGGLFLRRRK